MHKYKNMIHKSGNILKALIDASHIKILKNISIRLYILCHLICFKKKKMFKTIKHKDIPILNKN